MIMFPIDAFMTGIAVVGVILVGMVIWHVAKLPINKSREFDL